MSVAVDPAKKIQIKQAARELFFRFGFSKTSMDDIARQSGLAKPSLYYYYPNKEAIFDDVVLEEAQSFMDEIQRQLPPDAPADQKLMLFFRGIYERLKIYAHEMAEVPDVMCEHSPHGRPVIKKINKLFLDRLRPLLASGKAEGIFQFENLETTVQTLGFMTQFLNLEWMQRIPEANQAESIETMLQILLNGLRRRDQK